MEPAVRRSVSVHQECHVITWLESANENALRVVMERIVIRVGDPQTVLAFKDSSVSSFYPSMLKQISPVFPCQTVQREGLDQAASILVTAPAPHVTK